ncbi:hypothetical protein NC652_038481 [Populus alba x Populus x berolinensis]|nr:hypothetical protein NC652_038481 [Populus alba x Populus x berolinensis]
MKWRHGYTQDTWSRFLSTETGTSGCYLSRSIDRSVFVLFMQMGLQFRPQFLKDTSKYL